MSGKFMLFGRVLATAVLFALTSGFYSETQAEELFGQIAISTGETVDGQLITGLKDDRINISNFGDVVFGLRGCPCAWSRLSAQHHQVTHLRATQSHAARWHAQSTARSRAAGSRLSVRVCLHAWCLRTHAARTHAIVP